MSKYGNVIGSFSKIAMFDVVLWLKAESATDVAHEAVVHILT